MADMVLVVVGVRPDTDLAGRRVMCRAVIRARGSGRSECGGDRDGCRAAEGGEQHGAELPEASP